MTAMDISQFDTDVRADSDTLALARELAAEYQELGLVDGQGQYTTGVDLLLGIAVMALYTYAKDRLAHKRKMEDMAVVEWQTRLIAELTDKGLSPDKAATTVKGLYNIVSKRQDKDLPLQKIVAMIEKADSK